MKKKGITSKMDGLGRLVIPKKYREALSLTARSDIEFILLDNAILLQPCRVGICTACKRRIDLSKNYCANCGKAIVQEDK